MGKIKRVYIAGALTPHGLHSASPAIDYLINVRTMVRVALEALEAGFDPFVPALDGLFWLCAPEGTTITEPMIKRYSKSWLEACDAVLLVPEWQASGGTKAEIEFARRKGISVFVNLETMVKYNGGKDEPSDNSETNA